MADDPRKPLQPTADPGEKTDIVDGGRGIDRDSTPGVDTAAREPDAASASSLSGTGLGGDLDHPDVTGRGTTADLTGNPDAGIEKGPGGGLVGPAARRQEE